MEGPRQWGSLFKVSTDSVLLQSIRRGPNTFAGCIAYAVGVLDKLKNKDRAYLQLI